jgi:hypothetical protein
VGTGSGNNNTTPNGWGKAVVTLKELLALIAELKATSIRRYYYGYVDSQGKTHIGEMYEIENPNAPAQHMFYFDEIGGTSDLWRMTERPTGREFPSNSGSSASPPFSVTPWKGNNPQNTTNPNSVWVQDPNDGKWLFITPGGQTTTVGAPPVTAVPPGGVSTDSKMNIVTFYTPNITDIKKELKCFNLSAGAKLTIYAEQSIKGSRQLTTNIGHTFIGITQNDVTRNLGFYPDSPNASLISNQTSQIHDNSTSAFDISITIDVSANQLKSIINYISNYPNTYDLNKFNCTDFGIQVMSLGGLALPKTVGYAEFLGGLVKFKGDNPADLGEDMRVLKLPVGATRNTVPGKAPAKSGTCN